MRLGEDYFRTCIARDDRRRYFCAFVDTSTDPAEVTRDQQRGAELDLPAGARDLPPSGTKVRPPSTTSSTSTWLRPRRSARSREDEREELRRAAAQVEAAADRADAAVDDERQLARPLG